MPVPPSLARYTRITGSATAVALLSTTFPGLALVQLARATGTGVDAVQRLMAYGLLLGLALVVPRASGRAAQISSRRMLVASGAASAAGLIAAAAAPSGATLALALAGGASLARTTAPLRSVGSIRWPALRVTAQERSQSWTYGALTIYQVAFALVTGVAGVRFALVALAAIVIAHTVQLARWDALPEPGGEPARARGRSALAVLGLPAALLGMAALGVGVALFQMLFAGLQPHLVDAGLGASTASLVAALTGGARLISIPVLRGFSATADARLAYSWVVAARWMLLSGGLALLTLLPTPTAAAVASVVLAATALEIGQNCQNAAVRGYVADLSLSTAAIAVIVVGGFSYLGAQLAASLSWGQTALLWAAATAGLGALTSAMRRWPSRETGWRHWRGPGGMAELVLVPEGDVLLFTPERTAPEVSLREGDRVAIDSPFDPLRDPSPRVTDAVLCVTWGRRPVLARRRGGRLRFWSRFPLIGVDGLVYGYGRWRFGATGSWAVVEHPPTMAGAAPWFSMALRSATFEDRTTTWRHKRHHR